MGTGNSYTFSNVSSNHTISATFAIITFNLSSSAGTGGTVSPSGSTTINYGASQTVNIIPNTGYYISDVTVDNVSVGPVNHYTFTNVTANHTISASFAIYTYIITTTAEAGGSVTPSGTTTLNYGSQLVCSIHPDEGYLISDVKVDNVSRGAISSYTFTNVTSAHTLSATFKHITFNVSATSNSGGSITPPGITSVIYGTDQTYLITPDIGFRIADVIVNGQSVGSLDSYTFSNVKAVHSISVNFTIITYTVNIESNTGGLVNPAADTVVNYGTDLSCIFTPDYGFKVSDVKVDGVSQGRIPSYSLNHITDNHSVLVTFAPLLTYTITAEAGTGGTITPSGDLTLFEGSGQTYSIVPNSGYRIDKVLVDNNPVDPSPEYVFSDLDANHTISVKFTTSIDAVAYPNPFRDNLNLMILSPEDYHFDLSVVDMSTRLIYSLENLPGNEVIPINMNVAPGVYLLQIRLNGEKIAVVKVVKK